MTDFPPALVAALRHELPDLDLDGAELLGEGWNASAWSIGAGATKWVVRVPKLEWAAGEIERQTCLGMDLSRQGLPVPRGWRVLRGEDGTVLAGAYQYIVGRASPRRGVEALAVDVASFLTRLHDLPTGFALSECRALLLDPWLGRYRGLIETYGPVTGPQTRSWLNRTGERLERISRSASERVLVHGDLCPEHLICDAAGHLVGVLDFSGPQVTDPAVDFGRLVQHWGGRFAAAVLGNYDRLTDNAFEERMVIYAELEPLRAIEAGVSRELPHWVAWGRRRLAAATGAETRSLLR